MRAAGRCLPGSSEKPMVRSKESDQRRGRCAASCFRHAARGPAFRDACRILPRPDFCEDSGDNDKKYRSAALDASVRARAWPDKERGRSRGPSPSVPESVGDRRKFAAGRSGGAGVFLPTDPARRFTDALRREVPDAQELT